ncbi:MAG: hypothetical protein HQL40_05820 [Alphaproteobacteria bacterium]|nr:hypothetical protein [Alphaproteobacteria bacterium]
MNWLSLRDYDGELRQAVSRIMSRYSRGNVSVQNGSALDEAGLLALSETADKAMSRMSKRMSA